MRLRQLAQLGFPGFAVGLLAGVAAGGMAALVGQPFGWALLSTLALGIPLGVMGWGYSLLIAHGKVRLGGFAPAAGYWLVGFPLARLIQEYVVSTILLGQPYLSDDVLGFLAYQGLVSAGFAIGFLWLHERIAPQWWQRIAPNNPQAAVVFERYAGHARVLWEAREARRQAKRDQRERARQRR